MKASGYVFSVVVGLLLGVLFLGVGWWVYNHIYAHGLQATYQSSLSRVKSVLNRSRKSDLERSNPSPAKTILLVTLDTTRADHLSVYGYPRKTAPNLEHFARNAVRFDRAYAAMPTTVPSHATILSSLYPAQHGSLKNDHKMRTDVLTLAEHLGQEGYSTAAYVSTDRHFKSSRVAQGFDVYDAPNRIDRLVNDDSRPGQRLLPYRPAVRTFQRARSWLRNASDTEKIFLWVHYFDPHFPYAARMDIVEKVVRSFSGGRRDFVNFIGSEHHFDLIPGEADETIQDESRLRAYRLYDAEIRYMDQAVGQMLKLVKHHRRSNRLVVVVGDHGEGMGNHGIWGHGKHLYNEHTRVPLFVRFPGNRHSGRRVKTVVETNDILPTILRASTADTTVLDTRQFPIEGTPLQVLLRGDEEPFGFAFQQRKHYPKIGWSSYLHYRWLALRMNQLNYPFKHRWVLDFETGEKYALTGLGKKYIYSTTHPDELYDIRRDFYEQNNRLSVRGRVSRLLGTTLFDLADQLEIDPSTGPQKVDPETRKKLEGLGYIH